MTTKLASLFENKQKNNKENGVYVRYFFFLLSFMIHIILTKIASLALGFFTVYRCIKDVSVHNFLVTSGWIFVTR